MNRKQFFKTFFYTIVGALVVPSSLQAKEESKKEINKTPKKTPFTLWINIQNKGKNTHYNIDMLDVNNLKKRDLKISYTLKPFNVKVSAYHFLCALQDKPFFLKKKGVSIFTEGHNTHNVLIKKGENILYDFRIEHAAIEVDRNYNSKDINFNSNEIKCIIPVLEPNQSYSLECEIL